MVGRLFRSSFAVAVGAICLSIILFFGVLYQYFGNELMGALTAESHYLAQGVSALGQDYLDDLNSDRRITWIASDGTVQYDNWNEANMMENHLAREEIQETLSNGNGFAQRWSSTLSQQTLYAAKMLDDGSIIRVSSTQDTVFQLLFSMIQPILIILLLAVLLSAFLALRLSRSIIRPILAIDLEHPDDFSEYDELAPLVTRIRRQHATIHKQMAQLRHRQEEFSALTDNMSEGFLLLDLQGHILSYNSAILDLLHTTPPTQKNGFYLLLNRNEPFRHSVSEALGGHKCQQMLEVNGRYLQILANPIVRDDAPAGAVVVVLDITDRHRGEALRREFTANVSHELKTPLTSISGIAEIMKSGFVRPEDFGGFSTDIYNEAQRLIALVGDIIRLSQLDEGASTLERCEVNLHSLCSAVAARLSPVAEKAEVTLSLEGDSAIIVGALPVLDEMITNLVDNAIKYNRPDGRVDLCVKQDDYCVLLTISDTGVGIPAEDCQRVFERFYRVDKSHSKSIGGTGLGLSIVKHGAAYHDAQVTLDSAVGVGTTITLTFPIK